MQAAGKQRAMVPLSGTTPAIRNKIKTSHFPNLEDLTKKPEGTYV